MKIIYILLFIGLISCALLSSEVACAEDLQLNDDAILALLINENEEDEDEEDGDVMSKTFKEKFIRQRTLHLFNRKKLAKRAAKSATIGRSITNWVPRKKVINTPTGETIDTGGAVITPMSPEAGQIAAQGWLAKELGLEEKEIESLGYTSLDEPKNMGNGLVRHTSGASRYMFRFAVSGQERTEYLISGAWDLSVPPQDQKWIQIGTTIIGMTSGEGNLSIGNTEEETDDPGITKVPPVNELPVPTEYPKKTIVNIPRTTWTPMTVPKNTDITKVPPIDELPIPTEYPEETIVDIPRTNWPPPEKVVDTPDEKTITIGGVLLAPMGPETGQIAAQGWLAKELGLEEKDIVSLGYTSLDEPKNMENGLVSHTSGASRYMFRFAVSGQERTEYLISGAWDLSVPPQDQKWIQIGTTIIGMTSGEGNLSIGNTEEETDDPGITKVPPVNELPVPTEYPKEPDFSEIPPKVPGITKYPPEKVVDTPDEETITIGGAVIAPMSPEAGQIAAQGWLAKELGLEEKNIVSLGYMSPDEPKNMKNGFVRHIAGASRYMFKFAVSGQEGTEYLINGAWDLSVGPQDQKWIQIGTTIVGMTSGEDNLSVEFKECLNKNEIENKKATSKETNGYTIMPTMAGVDNKANQLLQQN